MLIELEILYDFFPLFYTVSLLLSVIGLYFSIRLSNDFLNRQYGNKSFHAKLLPSITDQPEISQHIRKQRWLTRTVKRKEAPEDDVDFILHSILFSIFKIEEDKCETTYKNNIYFDGVTFNNFFNGVSSSN